MRHDPGFEPRDTDRAHRSRRRCMATITDDDAAEFCAVEMPAIARVSGTTSETQRRTVDSRAAQARSLDAIGVYGQAGEHRAIAEIAAMDDDQRAEVQRIALLIADARARRYESSIDLAAAIVAGGAR